MQNRRRLAALAAFVVGAALFVACGDDDDTGEVKHTTGMTAWQGEEVVVRGKDFAFEPKEIRVKAETRYMLHMVNDAGQLHDWTIDAVPATEVQEYGAEHGGEHGSGAPTARAGMAPMNNSGMMRLHVAAEKRTEGHLSFMPMKKGEYTFYCSVGEHRKGGMEGKLIVE